jgi:hypothetical protein
MTTTAQMKLDSTGHRFKVRERDKLVFRSGLVLTYMGGFDTGGGCFQQLMHVRNGRNLWQTIPHSRFELLQKTGRAVFVPGEWRYQ